MAGGSSLIVVLLALIALVNGQSKFTISGRNIYLSGKQFAARGYAFSPVRIGQGPGQEDILSNANKAKWQPHLDKIDASGANVIRIYSDLAGAGPYDQFLSYCTSKGIFVILNYMTADGIDLTSASVKSAAKDASLKMVKTYTNNPAIFGWALGNEYDVGYSVSTFTSFVGEVIAYVKAQYKEPFPHPWMSPLADNSNLAGYITNLESAYPGTIDIWALQIYRGASFSTVWSTYKSASTRPMIITEYGNDAYNSISNAEDRTKQNLWIGYQAVEIEVNSVAFGGVSSGGLVFEWSDEWWKSSSYAPSVHDTTGNADIIGPPPHSFDNYVSPEWYGVVAVSQNGSNTNLPNIITTRTIYNTLKSMWTLCTFPTLNSIDTGNQLINGGFDVADTFYEYSSPYVWTSTALDGTLKFTNIQATSDGWNGQIKNPTSVAPNIQIVKGSTYTYSYQARADSARPLFSYIQPWTTNGPLSSSGSNAYGRDQCNVAGGSSWTTCSFTFTAVQNTATNGQFMIEFGGNYANKLVNFEVDNLKVTLGTTSPVAKQPRSGSLGLCTVTTGAGGTNVGNKLQAMSFPQIVLYLFSLIFYSYFTFA